MTPDTQIRSESGDDGVSGLQVVACVAVLLALGAAMAAPAGAETGAAADGEVPGALVVDLDDGGDAAVTVTIPFDLTVAEERTEFEAFVESEERQQTHLDRYESRLSSVASEAEKRTGREMAVREPGIAVRTRDGGELGLVVLSVTWEGLAAEDGRALRLGAPFDDGFNADRALVVRPPEQHRVVSATPSPTRENDSLVWEADRSLDGFEVLVEPGGTDDAAGGDGDSRSGQATAGGDATGAGFGVLVALLGIAVHARST